MSFEGIFAHLNAQVGRNIQTEINLLDNQEAAAQKRTVSMEARLFKRFFLKMRD